MHQRLLKIYKKLINDADMIPRLTIHLKCFLLLYIGINEEEKQKKQLKSERLLITWLINDNSLIGRLDDILTADDFADPIYQNIVKELYDQYKTSGKVEPAVIMDRYQSKEEHDKVASIIQQDFDMEVTPDEKSQVITDLVKQIKRKGIDQRIEAAKGDLNLMGQLMMEKKSIEKLNIRI